jgi:hypothetical protein
MLVFIAMWHVSSEEKFTKYVNANHATEYLMLRYAQPKSFITFTVSIKRSLLKIRI